MSSLSRSSSSASAVPAALIVFASLASLAFSACSTKQAPSDVTVLASVSASDTASATSVSVDPTGNVVVTGQFTGDLALGSTTLQATGLAQLFLAKLDGAGSAVWSQAIAADANGVVTDRAGNVIVAARSGPSAPGSALLSGFFISKVDPTGRYLWKTALGDAYDRYNLSVGGGGVAMLSSRTSDGLFVEMVDTSGTECWALDFPLACTNGMTGVVANTEASLAITGFYDCPVDFGGGPLTANGHHSFFAATFDANGNLTWSKGIGATGGDVIPATVAIDDSGNVFVAGSYSGALDFGVGALPSPSSDSATGVFIVKIGPKGGVVWSHGYTSSSGAVTPSGPQSLALSPSGQLFVLANTAGTVDLGTSSKAFSAEAGAFVVELTTDGEPVAVHGFTPASASSSFTAGALSIGLDGTVAFAGTLQGSVDFAGVTRSAKGSSDVVVGKLAN